MGSRQFRFLCWRIQAGVQYNGAFEQAGRPCQRADAHRATPILTNVNDLFEIKLLQHAVHPAHVVVQCVLADRDFAGKTETYHSRHYESHTLCGKCCGDLPI